MEGMKACHDNEENCLRSCCLFSISFWGAWLHSGILFPTDTKLTEFDKKSLVSRNVLLLFFLSL